MAELAPKKQRNCAIDFWHVFCTLAVAIMHFANRCWYLAPEAIAEQNSMCWNGGYVLGFFLLTSGYFMVASYKSKQRRGLTAIPAEKQATEYTCGRWKMLYPALLVVMIAGFIQICYTNGYNFEE